MDTPLAGASRPTARPEIELLLACARTHIGREESKRLEALLQGGVDWAYLLAEAGRHKMVPILYHCLARAVAHRVPDKVMGQLQTHYRANGVRNLALSAELLRVLGQLQRAGVLAVPYKGPVLAEVVYGDLSLREFTDLDVLVRAQDAAWAREALISMGYRLAMPERLAGADRLAHERGFAFRNAGSVAGLELHWEVAERYFGFRLDPQWWDRLDTVPFLGRQVAGPSAEDLLLILCVHGSRHGWARLAWVCDVAELVRAHPTMDWERALWQARRQGAQRMVLVGLSLASDLLGAALPTGVAARIQSDPAVKKLAAGVSEGLFQVTSVSPGTSGKYRLFGFQVRLREGLWGKVRYALRVAFLPTYEDVEALPLPEPLFFLYYVVRPFRLLRKHLWRPRRN